MRIRKFVGAGLAAMVVGGMLIGLSFSSGAVEAGNQNPNCVTPPAASATAVSDPTATSTTIPALAPNIVANAVAPTCVPPTATPTVKLLTHTPTATSTPAATQTPGPTNTAAPTNTVAPAPNTPANGAGNLGASVRPPNTGTGGSGGSGSTLWLLVGGVALLAIGGGSMLAGVRGRR